MHISGIEQSIIHCILIGCSYVAVLYLIPTEIRSLGRENLLNMKYRMTAVTIVTFLLMTFNFVNAAAYVSNHS